MSWKKIAYFIKLVMPIVPFVVLLSVNEQVSLPVLFFDDGNNIWMNFPFM